MCAEDKPVYAGKPATLRYRAFAAGRRASRAARRRTIRGSRSGPRLYSTLWTSAVRQALSMEALENPSRNFGVRRNRAVSATCAQSAIRSSVWLAPGARASGSRRGARRRSSSERSISSRRVPSAAAAEPRAIQPRIERSRSCSRARMQQIRRSDERAAPRRRAASPAGPDPLVSRSRSRERDRGLPSGELVPRGGPCGVATARRFPLRFMRG